MNNIFICFDATRFVVCICKSKEDVFEFLKKEAEINIPSVEFVTKHQHFKILSSEEIATRFLHFVTTAHGDPVEEEKEVIYYSIESYSIDKVSSIS